MATLGHFERIKQHVVHQSLGDMSVNSIKLNPNQCNTVSSSTQMCWLQCPWSIWFETACSERPHLKHSKTSSLRRSMSTHIHKCGVGQHKLCAPYGPRLNFSRCPVKEIQQTDSCGTMLYTCCCVINHVASYPSSVTITMATLGHFELIKQHVVHQSLGDISVNSIKLNPYQCNIVSSSTQTCWLQCAWSIWFETVCS